MLCGIAWILAGGDGMGFLQVRACVCMCRELIVCHDVAYGIQFFFIFIVIEVVGVKSVI